jgi:hypothetical protein
MSGIGSWRGTVGTGTDEALSTPAFSTAFCADLCMPLGWARGHDEYLFEKVYSMFMIMYEYKPYEYKPRW